MDNRKFLANAAGAAPTPPGVPSVGYPQEGASATQPGAYWFHQIGEELRAVIVAASLSPDSNSLAQVLQAMRALFVRKDVADTSPFGLTLGGVLNANAGISSSAIELGSTTTPAMPFIDLHSSGNNIDFDARIIASGGNASIGNGVLAYTAYGGHFFNGPATFNTGVVATTHNFRADALGAAIYNSGSDDLVVRSGYSGAGYQYSLFRGSGVFENMRAWDTVTGAITLLSGSFIKWASAGGQTVTIGDTITGSSSAAPFSVWRTTTGGVGTWNNIFNVDSSGNVTAFSAYLNATASVSDIQIRSLNQNVSSTLPRAWVLFSGTTGAITSSFNVSSVTRIAAGRYTVTFTNPFTSTTYAVFGTAASSATVQGVVSFNPAAIATNSIEVDVQSISGAPALTDFNQVRVSFIGV